MAAAITTSSTTLEGQALEILAELQEQESANPENDNRVTIGVDIEAGQVDLSVSLPATITSSGGSVSIQAQEYLSA